MRDIINFDENYTEYKHKKKYITYFKYWLIGIFAVSIFFSIIYFVYNNDKNNPVSYKCKFGDGPSFDDAGLKSIRASTPAYPPPLLNFMDASFHPFKEIHD